MIGKFKDFIKENVSNIAGPKSVISSREELEDHFLRLKEVLNCDISIYPSLLDNKIYIIIKTDRTNIEKSIINQYRDGVNFENIVLTELEEIKNRLEGMFPVRVYYRKGLKMGLGKFSYNLEIENN